MERGCFMWHPEPFKRGPNGPWDVYITPSPRNGEEISTTARVVPPLAMQAKLGHHPRPPIQAHIHFIFSEPEGLFELWPALPQGHAGRWLEVLPPSGGHWQDDHPCICYNHVNILGGFIATAIPIITILRKKLVESGLILQAQNCKTSPIWLKIW